MNHIEYGFDREGFLMLIEFDKMETAVIPHMRGGEKTVSAQMLTRNKLPHC